MFCREQVAQLRDVVGRVRQRGAELHVIGSGSREEAEAFRREREIDFPLYVDPTLASYRAAGLRRDLGATVSPRVLGNVVRTLRGGFRQGRTQGDPWQQGGAFVIAPGGATVFAQVSRVAGDHVEPAALLRALESLAI